jgi:hypothetical protein
VDDGDKVAKSVHILLVPLCVVEACLSIKLPFGDGISGWHFRWATATGVTVE